MARARGNARKRKTRLTNQTFSAVMDLSRRAEPEAVDEVEGAEPVTDSLEFNILDLLRAEPEVVSVPAAYNEPASIFTPAGGFATDRYVLGLMQCSECRNEMMYYQRREILSAGYAFRCRICQHELLATLD